MEEHCRNSCADSASVWLSLEKNRRNAIKSVTFSPKFFTKRLSDLESESSNSHIFWIISISSFSSLAPQSSQMLPAPEEQLQPKVAVCHGEAGAWQTCAGRYHLQFTGNRNRFIRNTSDKDSSLTTETNQKNGICLLKRLRDLWV